MQGWNWGSALARPAAVRPRAVAWVNSSRLVRSTRCAAARLADRMRLRIKARWPAIRRTLPRDLVLLLWAALLLQHFGIGWVATDSVNTNLVLIHKAVAPKAGELAVFGYAGGQIPNY